jgi:hypothetical protein
MMRTELGDDSKVCPSSGIVFMGDSIRPASMLTRPCAGPRSSATLSSTIFADAGQFPHIEPWRLRRDDASGLERFPNDLQQHRPDIVTIQFGLNECNCWVSDGGLPRVSEAAYRANLIEMIERARRFGRAALSCQGTQPKGAPL